MTQAKSLQRFEATRSIEGAGFVVMRSIPNQGVDAVGPFIFLDHFGPIDVPPGAAKGAPEHPHAGIETLSYLLEGRSRHLDGLGNESSMGAGEVQWMRAGRGLVHDEGPDAQFLRDGGRIHGFQLWINMPSGHKHDAPQYRHFDASQMPTIRDGECVTKVVAGEIAGVKGPVQTHGAAFLSHVHMPRGSSTVIEVPRHEAALYLAQGLLTIEGLEQDVGPNQLIVCGRRDSLKVTARQDSDLLLLGGEPIDAPLVRYGPFVMNTSAEIEQAIHLYQSGGMGRIDPARKLVAY